MEAAERVFFADTRAAIAQIELSAAIPGLAQPLAAASLAVLAAAFGGSIQDLVRVVKQETGPVDRGLRDRAIALAAPADDFGALCQWPGGVKVAGAWRERGLALADYQRASASNAIL